MVTSKFIKCAWVLKEKKRKEALFPFLGKINYYRMVSLRKEAAAELIIFC